MKVKLKFVYFYLIPLTALAGCGTSAQAPSSPVAASALTRDFSPAMAAILQEVGSQSLAVFEANLLAQVSDDEVNVFGMRLINVRSRLFYAIAHHDPVLANFSTVGALWRHIGFDPARAADPAALAASLQKALEHSLAPTTLGLELVGADATFQEPEFTTSWRAASRADRCALATQAYIDHGFGAVAGGGCNPPGQPANSSRWNWPELPKAGPQSCAASALIWSGLQTNGSGGSVNPEIETSAQGCPGVPDANGHVPAIDGQGHGTTFNGLPRGP